MPRPCFRRRTRRRWGRDAAGRGPAAGPPPHEAQLPPHLRRAPRLPGRLLLQRPAAGTASLLLTLEPGGTAYAAAQPPAHGTRAADGAALRRGGWAVLGAAARGAAAAAEQAPCVSAARWVAAPCAAHSACKRYSSRERQSVQTKNRGVLQRASQTEPAAVKQAGRRGASEKSNGERGFGMHGKRRGCRAPAAVPCQRNCPQSCSGEGGVSATAVSQLRLPHLSRIRRSKRSAQLPPPPRPHPELDVSVGPAAGGHLAGLQRVPLAVDQHRVVALHGPHNLGGGEGRVRAGGRKRWAEMRAGQLESLPPGRLGAAH